MSEISKMQDRIIELEEEVGGFLGDIFSLKSLNEELVKRNEGLTEALEKSEKKLKAYTDMVYLRPHNSFCVGEDETVPMPGPVHIATILDESIKLREAGKWAIDALLAHFTKDMVIEMIGNENLEALTQDSAKSGG